MAKGPLVDRRKFLAGSAGDLSLNALTNQIAPPQSQVWDAGQVRHFLPTVRESSVTEPKARKAACLSRIYYAALIV